MAWLDAQRRRGEATPALVLTARDRLADRIGGLDAGADDYLVKPFAPEELAARLRAVSRRAGAGAAQSQQQYGSVMSISRPAARAWTACAPS